MKLATLKDGTRDGWLTASPARCNGRWTIGSSSPRNSTPSTMN
jgi:hypothetical protein